MYIYNNFSECQGRLYLGNVVMKSVPYILYLCLNVERFHSVSNILRLRISSVISRVFYNRSLFLLKSGSFGDVAPVHVLLEC